MATNTTNLNLIKPSGTDKIRIAQINQNMDILDEKIGAVGNTSLQAQISTINSELGYGSTNKMITLASISNDVNNAKNPGIIMFAAADVSSISNLPVQRGGYILVFRNATNEVVQVYVLRNTTNVNDAYLRIFAAGTWSPWAGIALTDRFSFEDVTLTAGTNITINWQRCKKNGDGLTILEATFTAGAAISAGSSVITGAPSIGGNMQFFTAVSDGGTIIPLGISGGAISVRTSIASGTKVRFIVSYFWTT